MAWPSDYNERNRAGKSRVRGKERIQSQQVAPPIAPIIESTLSTWFHRKAIKYQAQFTGQCVQKARRPVMMIESAIGQSGYQTSMSTKTSRLPKHDCRPAYSHNLNLSQSRAFKVKTRPDNVNRQRCLNPDCKRSPISSHPNPFQPTPG